MHFMSFLHVFLSIYGDLFVFPRSGGGEGAKTFPRGAAALGLPHLTKNSAKKHAKNTLFCTRFGQSKVSSMSAGKTSLRAEIRPENSTRAIGPRSHRKTE